MGSSVVGPKHWVGPTLLNLEEQFTNWKIGKLVKLLQKKVIIPY